MRTAAPVHAIPGIRGKLTVSKIRKGDFLNVDAVNSIVAMHTELKSIFPLEIDGL